MPLTPNMSVTRQNPYQMLFLDTIKISWVSPFLIQKCGKSVSESCAPDFFFGDVVSHFLVIIENDWFQDHSTTGQYTGRD
jgi:hypothetical protein